MFKINHRPEFTVDVQVAPQGAGEAQTLRTVFRALSDDEVLDHDTTSIDGYRNLLRAAVVRFEDLVDPDGKPLACTPEVISSLLSWPHIRSALNGAYWQALHRARVGN